MFKEFVIKVIEILENSDIEYVIVGGIAAIYYGQPRSTEDIDIIVDLKFTEKEKIEKLCWLFTKNGFKIMGNCDGIIESLKEKSHITIYDQNYIFRVDLQGIYNRLNVLAFEGRRRVKIFDREAWLQSPEDLIIAKLTYYVSNRDMRDVVAIIKNSFDLIDMNRLMRLAEEFGIKEKVEMLLEKMKE